MLLSIASHTKEGEHHGLKVGNRHRHGDGGKRPFELDAKVARDNRACKETGARPG